jgi:DNA-binding MarR family transcriptional regulator
MKTEDNPAPECMIFLLSKAYQRGHALVKKRLQPFGLTNLQYLILETLWLQDGLTAGELGAILAIDKATLSGVLDRMTEGGWIEKKEDERDRRAVRVMLTDKSRSMKEALRQERQAANDELLSCFSVEEKVLLRRLLKDMM